MKFTKIPSDAFQKLQINAGILTTDFTPATGTIGEAGQIGATTGGVNFTATPTYSDFGEDIDNCPKNMKEMKRLDSWEAKMAGTFINADTKIAKSLCGAADVSTSDGKVTPRNDLSDADFAEKRRLHRHPPDECTVHRRLPAADQRQGKGPVCI